MFFLNVYTRKPAGDNYSPSLAGSIHLRYGYEDNCFTPLNNNYGILFPKAEIRDNNTIDARCIKDSACYEKDGLYGIGALYCDLEYNEIYTDKMYFWTTEDFIFYDEKGLIDKASLKDWNIVAGNTFKLSDKTGRNIVDAFAPLRATEVFVPSNICIADTKELQQTEVVFKYSDGSTDNKKVDWDIPPCDVDSDGHFLPGYHEINGTVHKDIWKFPLAIGYADPVLFKWEGFWYFLSTNDNLGNIGMFVRKSLTEHGLFDGNYTERCILSYNLEKGFVQTFWAPEFHVIGGNLYILFAVGGVKWAPQCHMMMLKPGGDILEPTDWEDPIRVMKPNGQYLTDDAITLDMTHFVAKGEDYLVWSYRRNIATSLDSGSMLCIAKTSAEKPWQLITEPVLLSRPLYGWEHTVGTINNEGPYALISDSKIYLSYSGGSANGYSYVVGYLITDISEDVDLLDPLSWHKTPCPVLSSYSVGIDGPGHNSFYISDEGKTMIAYHGQLHTRCSAIHRVHFNKRGFPLLNMTVDMDVPDCLRKVQIGFTV